jgi:hypothetical protein
MVFDKFHHRPTTFDLPIERRLAQLLRAGKGARLGFAIAKPGAMV